MDSKGICIGGSLLAFITILIASLCLGFSYHTIEEGYVGVYFIRGRLDNTYSNPGVNWMSPFITEVHEIRIRAQTDVIDPLTTYTQDGIGIKFHDIQVINRVNVDHVIELVKKYGLRFKYVLIYDRIRSSLRDYSANHIIDDVYSTKFQEIKKFVINQVESKIRILGNNSVEILNLVIPKPDIPHDIAENYQKVKLQWTEQLVATQVQKTEQIKKETENIKATLDAEREKDVKAIELQKLELEKNAEKTRKQIDNQIEKARLENLANLELYKRQKQAEANKALYTPEYVKLQMAMALSNNTKFYFSGENSPLGSLFGKILN